MKRHVGARHADTRQIIANQRIHQGIAAHFEGVRRIAIAGAGEASAGAQGQARQRAIKEGVVAPQGRHMFRHLRWRVAFVIGVGGVFHIGIGIRTHHIDVGGKRRFGFQFKTTRTDFAAFNREECTRRITHQVVGFGELIYRTGQHNRTIFGYIFHAGFVLFAFGRSKDIAIRANG
ncbi:hypothetical protein D3C78_1198230 [compost metagenome]